jgi:hypothetical protein
VSDPVATEMGAVVRTASSIKARDGQPVAHWSPTDYKGPIRWASQGNRLDFDPRLLPDAQLAGHVFHSSKFDYALPRKDFYSIQLSKWTVEEADLGLIIRPEAEQLGQTNAWFFRPDGVGGTDGLIGASTGDSQEMAFLVPARLWIYSALELGHKLFFSMRSCTVSPSGMVPDAPTTGLLGMRLYGSAHSIFRGPALPEGNAYLFPIMGDQFGVKHSKTNLLKGDTL